MAEELQVVLVFTLQPRTQRTIGKAGEAYLPIYISYLDLQEVVVCDTDNSMGFFGRYIAL